LALCLYPVSCTKVAALKANAESWTFLTNHALVLSVLARHPRIIGRELFATVGITERATQNKQLTSKLSGILPKRRKKDA